VYKPLDDDITPTIKAEIDCKLESLCLAGMIDKEMKEFCMPPRNHRTSRLYFLKIQKNPMGIRPIVSSCNSITENISEFVDICLQPLMRDLPSFIKDTTEFIRLIETPHYQINASLCPLMYHPYTLTSHTMRAYKQL